MKFKVHNKNNCPTGPNYRCYPLSILVHCGGTAQLSSSTVKLMGLIAGDGVEIIEDEEFGDLYLRRKSVKNGGFILRSNGKRQSLSFTNITAARIIFDAAGAQGLTELVCDCFPYHYDGTGEDWIGIDIRHARAYKRGAKKASEATAAPAPKKRGRPAKKDQK